MVAAPNSGGLSYRIYSPLLLRVYYITDPHLPVLIYRSLTEDLYGLAQATGWEPYDLHDLTKRLDLYS